MPKEFISDTEDLCDCDQDYVRMIMDFIDSFDEVTSVDERMGEQMITY